MFRSLRALRIFTVHPKLIESLSTFPPVPVEEAGKERFVGENNALAIDTEQTSKSDMKYLFGFDFCKLKS